MKVFGLTFGVHNRTCECVGMSGKFSKYIYYKRATTIRLGLTTLQQIYICI